MSDSRIDSHKLLYHPARVAQWLAEGDCFPIYVEIGLTNRCNHRCAFCALDWLEGKKIDMGREVLLAALKEMAAHGVRSLMFAGEGESLLHPDAPLFMRTASELGMKVAVTTNGVPLTPEKAEACLPWLTWLRFSVNGPTPEQYAAAHGTRPEDFRKVLDNIAAAAAIKKRLGLKVDIGVQTLLLPESLDNIVDLAGLVRATGADNFQIKPYSQHPESKNRVAIDPAGYLDLEPKFAACATEDFRIHFRRNTIHNLISGADYETCHGLPFFALITAAGDIIPCNLFYNRPEFSYGNLNELGFAAIWQGEKRRRVRELLAARDIGECRQICRLDPLNRYLHRLRHPEESDAFV